MKPLQAALNLGENLKNENLSPSADVLHNTSTWLFHVVALLTRAKKWTKMKNARGERAKLLFLSTKYANL